MTQYWEDVGPIVAKLIDSRAADEADSIRTLLARITEAFATDPFAPPPDVDHASPIALCPRCAVSFRRSHLGKFDTKVIMVHTYEDQAHAVWSQAVPPQPPAPAELIELYSSTVIAGIHDNADGIYAPLGDPQLFWNEWRLRGAPPIVWRTIKYGTPYDFWREPVLTTPPLNLFNVNGNSLAECGPDPPFSAQEEFRRVASGTGKWEGPLSYTPQLLTPMHYVCKVKDDGTLKHRLVFDCKKSGHNLACNTATVAYHEVDDAIAITTPTSVQYTADEPDAFLGKPRWWGHRDCVSVIDPSTGLAWRHGYTAFGTTDGPYIQSRAAQAVSVMRAQGWGDGSADLGPVHPKANVVLMMDDYYGTVESSSPEDIEPARVALRHLTGLLTRLGIGFHPEKTQAGIGLPFKGVVINPVTDLASIPEKKLDGALRLATELIATTDANDGWIGAIQCARVAGKFNYMATYVRNAKSHVYSFIHTLYPGILLRTKLDATGVPFALDGRLGDPFAFRPSDRAGHRKSRIVDVIPSARTWCSDDSVRLTDQARKDIAWWIEHSVANNGVKMYLKGPIKGIWAHRAIMKEFVQGIESHRSIDELRGWTTTGIPVLTSDASGLGLGGWFDSEAYAVHYTPALRERLPHISVGELYGMFLLLKRVGPYLVPGPDGDNRILLRIDNTQAVAAINKGYSPSLALDNMARDVLDFADSLGVNIVAIHIPGKINVLADDLSRGNARPYSSDFTFHHDFRSELERELGVRHDPEAFADGLGANASCDFRCWIRRSFFNERLQGRTWWINPDFRKLAPLMAHLLSERDERFAATLLWPRLGTAEESRLRSQLGAAGFRLHRTYPPFSVLFSSRPAYASFEVFDSDMPPVTLFPRFHLPLEAWSRPLH